ncbi:LCP family protein [Kineothrix sp. MB12-C1]|uniref:LCP family protein n=1 Tax=Kineothrix sp. MB12-C1 TaxID=3070215 RepID=UPI0027D278FB|nr:LCP family protein [Kineothrix sp. MB12-C1]WMC91774.1 LCP family protein [Kineothrix sp. MB12-C1]
MATNSKKSGRSEDTKMNSKSKKMSAKEKERRKRKKIVLFIVEIFILLIMVGVLYFVLKGEKVGKVELNADKLVINEEVKQREETTNMKGYRNIALFGVDSTTGALTKNTRSDTIMIASINLDTGNCKLVSVYRDTYLNLSNDTYNKCNSAYAKGGPEMAINMLNMNMDMNITDFITVGFAGLTDTIDALGGIMVDVDSAEIHHLNSYQFTMAEDLKRPYKEVTETGYQLLSGLQATAYCRIRYTAGDDFKRAERQREVLMAVADKAKTASPATLNQIANDVFSEIYTSLDLTEILELLGGISKYNIVDQAGFPYEQYRTTGTIGSKGSCVIPVDLKENVEWLHKFLFDEEYTVSSDVQSYSDKIKSDTASYIR